MERRRITDITLTLKEPMAGFKKSVSKTYDTDGWNASMLNIYSHAGTHMDAPIHFNVNNEAIDDLPIDRFICNCHIIRLAPADPKLMLTPEHLGKTADKVMAGEGLLFHTGWSQYIENLEMYRNSLPRIGSELAQWMADKSVNLVGVEPPSVADVNNLVEVRQIHRILMEANILIMEGICNLESVVNDYVQLIALPLKIGGGDGAPVRAIVIEL